MHLQYTGLMTTTTQIQVRIDTHTKQAAQTVLTELGLDLSTAVKILCKQIVNSGTFPLELRDINGFRPDQAKLLQQARQSAKTNPKKFRTSKALLRDLMA